MSDQPKLIFDDVAKKTRRAFLWTGFLNEPLLALFTLLPFILRKDLNATLFQISLFTTLKPLMAVFSFYWSSLVNKKRGKLKRSLIWAWVLARLPFLLLPLYCKNVWLLLLASAFYLIFSRAGTPAQIEILKLNLPKRSLEKIFSKSLALNYLLGAFIGVYFGNFLDTQLHRWGSLFFFAALLGLIAIFIQRRIPVRGDVPEQGNLFSFVTLKEGLISPWKQSFQLLHQRPDFAHFQMVFMIGGSGLMLIAPALIFYYVDVLHLSHIDMTLSRFVWMACGFVLSSPVWTWALSKFSIFRITSFLCFGFSLVPMMVYLSQNNLVLLYVAFFVYGIAQGASHLVWHLSGPIFAGQEDSSLFSTVNTLTVGLRGLFAPLIGGVLCKFLGATAVLFIGAFVCFCAFFFSTFRNFGTKGLKPR